MAKLAICEKSLLITPNFAKQKLIFLFILFLLIILFLVAFAYSTGFLFVSAIKRIHGSMALRNGK